MIKVKIFNQYHSLSELWKLRKPLVKLIVSWKKMINLVLTILDVIMKPKKVWAAPLFIMIEPSSICNFRCPMCPMNILNMRRAKSLLDYDTYSKVIREIGDTLVSLVLWNFGEPFMNPDLFRMIKTAKDYNIVVGISTNGSLIDSINARNLIKSGLDYLIVSVDGATRDTYSKYRKGGDFDKVIDNIKNLIQLKRQMGKNLPFVNMQCILMRDTVGEIKDFIALGRELGVDKVSFKKLHYVHLLNEEIIPGSEYIREGSNEKFCFIPFISAVVLSDGSVLPCCNDLNSRHIMGNVTAYSFFDIWNNKEFCDFREKIKKDYRKIDICEKCYRTNFQDTYLVDIPSILR